MRNMVIVVVGLAAGCGGGSAPPLLSDAEVPDAEVPIDASAPPLIIDAPNVDAPPDTSGCSFVADLGALGIGPGTGDCNGAAGCTGNWFFVPDEGPNTGVTTFWVFANLDGLPQLDNDPTTPGSNAMGIEVVSNAGVFPLGVTSFDTTPTVIAGTNPFQTGTQTYVAAAYLFGKLDQTGSFKMLYSATSGSINVTAIDTIQGSAVKATVAATTFHETDAVAFVAGGCTSAVQGLSFNLTQMGMAKPSAPNQSTMQKAIKRIKQMRGY